MIYAGTDTDGNQLTFVFDTENNALAINQKKPDGTSETLAGTYEETEGENSSVMHFTTEAGAESDLELVPLMSWQKRWILPLRARPSVFPW